MDYRGYAIKLQEFFPNNNAYELPTALDGVEEIRTTKAVFVASSKFGTALATVPETAINDAKAMIDRHVA